MRIRCPDCDSEYAVPDALMQRPRPVRCSNCNHRWTPESAEAEEEPPAVEPAAAPPEPPPPPLPHYEPAQAAAAVPPPELRAGARITPPSGAAPARGLVLVLAAWTLSFAVLGGLGWEAYARRESVIAAWPASERAYAAMGFAPAGE